MFTHGFLDMIDMFDGSWTWIYLKTKIELVFTAVTSSPQDLINYYFKPFHKLLVLKGHIHLCFNETILALKVKEEANFRLKGVDVKSELSRMSWQIDVNVQLIMSLVTN